MEKEQLTTPIWCSNTCFWNEWKRKDVHYTYPDWGNAGPDILPSSHHINSQHMEDGMWLEPLISSSSSCFTTLKDIQKKFPIQATFQHSYPVLEPRRLYSQHSVQYTHAGNCLDAVKVGDQTVLVHVEYGRNDQTVVTSRLMPGRYYKSDKFMDRDTYFHLERQNSVLIDQCVYQVVSTALHNDIQVLVRTPTAVQLTGLRQTGLEKENQKILSSSFTSDAALSSYLPGLWSLVTVTGKVTLHDTGAKQPIWTTQCRETKGIMNAPSTAFKCEFGRHPLFLFVGNERSVYLYDTRVHPNYHRTLFDIKKVQDHVSDLEHVCFFVTSGDQPHLYLVMDETVYVVDDRQQKTPLMQWRHMLAERPTYSTLNQINSFEIFVLSNSQGKEVCMIASEWEYDRQQCHGVSVPCHFPTLHDTNSFAHSHGLWFTNQVQERLEDSMWLGMTSVPHPIENGSLLFLSMHSSGDIFCNTFQNSHLKADSPVFGEDQPGLPVLRKWELDVVDTTTHNWSCDNANYCEITGYSRQLLSKPSSSRHVQEILAGLPDIKLCSTSSNKIKTMGSVMNKRNEQTFSNSRSSTRNCSRIIAAEEKVYHYNEKKSTSETSFIWNLKDQVLKAKSCSTTKPTRNAAWLTSLMETYAIDPILDPADDLPLHLGDSCTEDSLDKFLPGSVLVDLKIDKLKKSKDILSPKIISLWLEGRNLNSKYEEPRISGLEANGNKQPSSLLGVLEGPERKHGFQYHTAPLDLARLSVRLPAYKPYYNTTDRSSELDKLTESYNYPPQTTVQASIKPPVMSKRSLKKMKKKKRVDGF